MPLYERHLRGLRWSRAAEFRGGAPVNRAGWYVEKSLFVLAGFLVGMGVGRVAAEMWK